MKPLGLRAQIVGVTTTVLFVVLTVVEAYQLTAEATTADEVRRSVEALGEALEVSIQQLGPSSRPDEDLLRDYVRRLGAHGVQRITVLTPEKGRLAGSHVEPHAFVIEKSSERSRRDTFDLLVPVVTGARKLGYVQIRMSTEDLTQRLGAIQREQWSIAAVVLAGGLVVAWLLARRIARPLELLRTSALRIREGQFDAPLPSGGSGEVEALVGAFKEMARGLAEREALAKVLAEREREAMLGRVAASVAHDVRNPLNYLSLAVDHLLTTTPQPEAKEIGAQMKAEIQRANQRIADLLRLGKPVELHPRDLEVEPLLLAVAGSAGRPGSVRVGKAAVGVVRWDPTAVEGILRNLVTNALEAGDARAEVELWAEADGEAVQIHVDDRGPGIGPELLPRLFEPYVTTKTSGVGLGLFVARRAAVEQGGTLTAAQREGGGARFTLRLPRQVQGGQP